MKYVQFLSMLVCVVVSFLFLDAHADLQEKTTQEQRQPAAVNVGIGSDWNQLAFDDFLNINCKDDTWSSDEGIIKCNGNCNGGFRTKKQYRNFEIVMQWKHLRRSGNAGVFIWSPEETVKKMKPGELPQGIEIQILDHGYAEDYEKNQGKKSDWFTTHGDVFPCGVASMKPFMPAAPNGKRSFPSAEHSKGFGQWNQYYIRAINGEVRLWVNGHEVSGGNDCDPAFGYIVLEAEGAPVEYRNIRIRELP